MDGIVWEEKLKLKKVLVNYADAHFQNAQRYCTKMAYRKGNFDEVWEYRPDSIEVIVSQNVKLVTEKEKERAGKYGLWRPLVISDALSKLAEGDILFYCDSGAFFNKSVDVFIEILKKEKLYLMCFDIPTVEKQWTKRDVFIYFDADAECITDTNQRMSGMFLVKKCRKSCRFFEEFKNAVLNMPSLFTDAENLLGKPNYDVFIESRHNQSVFSILTKVYGIEAFKDPTEFGDFPEYYRYRKGLLYLPTKNRIVDYHKVIISHRYARITPYRRLKLLVRRNIPAKIYFGISFKLFRLRERKKRQ